MPGLRVTRIIQRPEINPKGITVVHVSGAMEWGGEEQQLACLVEEMDAIEEMQQVVICPRGSKIESWCRRNSAEHIAVKRYGELDLLFAWQIRRLCKKIIPDLLHLHDSHSLTLGVISALVFKNTVPMVLSSRDESLLIKSRFSRFKYNHSSIRSILCSTDAIMKILQGIVRNQSVLTVVQNGVDLEELPGTVSGKNSPISKMKMALRTFNIYKEILGRY